MFFRCFLSKKEQNVRFQNDYQGKPLIIERQFSQNGTVFMVGTACFFNWVLVEKQRENSGRFSRKAPYNRTTIFSKRNGFYDRCFLFFDVFLSKKRTKGEISDRFSAKTPYNRMTIFTKRNGFL